MGSIYKSNKNIPSGPLLMGVCTPTHTVASSLACNGTSFSYFKIFFNVGVEDVRWMVPGSLYVAYMCLDFLVCGFFFVGY